MNAPAPGWYGKIAGLGDFASRRLPSEWVATCDAWLSTVLADAREDLGARWLDVYLSAPLLRFAWSARVVDERWWFGVLMPSCDSVGRYFPLVIAAFAADSPTSPGEASSLERWYGDVGRAALATLDDDGGSLDGLERALTEIPSWQAGSSSSGASALLATVAELASGRGRSAWWAHDGSPADAVIVDGLPRGTCFADLLAWRPHDDLSTVVGR